MINPSLLCPGLYALILSMSTLVSAVEIDELYGSRGSDSQCAGDLLVPGGTLRASPFNVMSGWIEHRNIWGRITWLRTGQTSRGTIAEARALCGEDDTRDYRIEFRLNEERLWLQWDKNIENGPLKRCQ